VYRAICLFTPQLLQPTYSSLTTEGGLRLSIGLGAWFCAEVVYPSKYGHPPSYRYTKPTRKGLRCFFTAESAKVIRLLTVTAQARHRQTEKRFHYVTLAKI